MAVIDPCRRRRSSPTILHHLRKHERNGTEDHQKIASVKSQFATSFVMPTEVSQNKKKPGPSRVPTPQKKGQRDETDIEEGE